MNQTTQSKNFEPVSLRKCNLTGNPFIKHPEYHRLTKDWHPTLNHPFNLSNFKPGSGREVWWKCSKGHEWQARIRSRYYGHGCPYCSGNILAPENSLQIQNSSLAQEWNHEKNLNLKPFQVSPGSGKKVWWKCSKGHEWQAIIKDRNNGKGCPYCVGKRVTYFESIKYQNPVLNAEWHPTRNASIAPSEIGLNSSRNVWWLCSKGHEWKASVRKRAKGLSCPKCTKKKIKPKALQLFTFKESKLGA